MRSDKKRTRQLGELIEDATDRLRRGHDGSLRQQAADDSHEAAELQGLYSLLQGLNALAHEGSSRFAQNDVAVVLPTESALPVFDDFEVIREIGRGGMAIVYEAQQRTLGRRVALKVLPISMAMDGKKQRRFLHEAQAAAALTHPHIVPVYTVGSSQGCHYYAMRLIAGQSLAQFVGHLRQETAESRLWQCFRGRKQDTWWSLRRDNPPCRPITGSLGYANLVAWLGIQTAEALEYAHSAGIVHRDIKPSNLLVCDTGHLWVADFGLAFTSDIADLTNTGDIVGTLRYMSPEQLRAKPSTIDHRTDIYSLGLTLYELLTLSPAHPSGDRQELLNQIACYPPPCPRSVDPAIPRALSAVVVKAMAEKPDDRYVSAAAMAADLRRFLQHDPVSAKPHIWVEHAVKACRRKPNLMRVTLWGVPVLATVFLLCAQLFQARETARIADDRSQASRATANRQVKEIEQQLQHVGERLDHAHVAVDGMFATLIDELAKLPQSDEVQHVQVEKTLALYETLIAAKPSEHALRHDLAIGLNQLGEIHHRLGHISDSEESLRRASRLLWQLVASAPDEPSFQESLAENLKLQFHIYLDDVGRRCAAENLIRQRIELLRKLIRRVPSDLDYARELACSLTAYGELLTQLGQQTAAVEQFLQAQDVWWRICQQTSDPSRDTPQLVRSHQKLGDLRIRQMQWEQAAEQLREALRLCQDVTDDSDPLNLDNLVLIYQNLARLDCHSGDFWRAELHLHEAEEISRKLSQRSPAVIDYGYRLAEIEFDLSQVIRIQQRDLEARMMLDQSTRRLEQMCQGTKGGIKELLALARNEYLAGLVGYYAEDRTDARRRFRRAEEILESCHASFPAAGTAASQLAWLLVTCPDPSDSSPERAVELVRFALRREPWLALHWRTLGAAQYRNGEWDQAAIALEKACQLKQSIDGFDWFLKALVDERLGRCDEALHCYNEGVRWMQQSVWEQTLLIPLRNEANSALQSSSSTDAAHEHAASL